MPEGPIWTAEENETLARLVAEGRSAGQIAAVIGRSRNAVIGRCLRSKLALKGKRCYPAKITKAKPAAPALVKAAPPAPRPPVAIFRPQIRPAPAARPKPVPVNPLAMRRMHDIDLMKLFNEERQKPADLVLQPSTGMPEKLGIRVYTKIVTAHPVPGQSGDPRAMRVSLPYVSILGARA